MSISKITFVKLRRDRNHSSITMLFSIQVHADVVTTVGPEGSSVTTHFASFKDTFVNCVVWHDASTYSVRLSSLHLAIKLVPNTESVAQLYAILLDLLHILNHNLSIRILMCDLRKG